MLLSFALILLLGMLSGWLCGKLRLPPLFGMLLTGMLLGPYVLNWIDPSVLSISPQLRRIALIIILLRAGLSLKLSDLRKSGRSAVLMCFIPAVAEIIGTALLAPRFFPLSRIDALLLGTVIAAVSPAVVVPGMLKVMEEGYGVQKGIPQMILAGASADDVFVMVLFASLTGIALGGNFQPAMLVRIPSSVLLGILGGVGSGLLLNRFLQRFHPGETRTVILFFCLSFLLVSLEDAMTGLIGFSGLLAVMSMGMAYAARSPEPAAAVSSDLSCLWTAAEILLFVLVGASVDLRYALQAGPSAVILLLCVLVFRMAGVAACLLGTPLSSRERLFCMLSYIPKATVQAAIGSIPFSLGLACGETILTVAVTAILVTAPLGSALISISFRRLLTR